ncbi:MAG: 6-phosphogluconate dehydrogenase (decarboxylating) [candidate division Zixibacteria bacterium RBG_16_53_22]|nr:MAG: 6-phosphogluconate dehydrogenase (decarboxylating) [candidate division Zixibacteria bacterium RBG_16_53_22]
MELGIIGLGRMGGNMARRLLRGGHKIVAYNRSWGPVEEVVKEGAVGARSPEELVAKLKAPRGVWLMLPAGKVTDDMIVVLISLLSKGDIIIDGGNSNYKDTIRRAQALSDKGLEYVDVGTSGGIWGLSEGYSLMIGGNGQPVERLGPIFKTLAPEPDKGWGHVGPHGAGHFVKMVHNGIEYGMMQALAEGFSILEHKKELGLDLHQVSRIWQHGSVVRSWLLDLTANALEESRTLDQIAPFVADSGEGRWTVSEAIDLDVPAPVITLSLIQRLRSRDQHSFADRLLAAMRNQFGGHAMKMEGGNG